MAGRALHASLHLLDRQIVGKRDGRLIAKVDDVEIALDVEPPHVIALLSGPQALGQRLPGLLGALVRSVHARLHPDRHPAPNTIPAARIVDVTSAVIVDSGDDLRVQGFGDWLDEQVVSRVPGSGHEA
jgi:sporulation protein YlmC with PRC-barrel domain